MNKRLISGFLFALLVVMLFSFTSFADDGGTGFGVLSLLPPIIAIVLAFWTKQVIFSLFLGVWVGATMLNGWNPGIGFLRTVDTHFVGSLADSWNAAIIIFTLTIGGMIGIIQKTGGTVAIANALSKKVKDDKSAQFFTSLLGVFVFFDDYANTLVVGPTMRPLMDKMKVSREKLAYIVDSTAAPVVGLAVVSTWVGYEIGLIGDAYASLNIDTNVFMLFLKSIPFTFYNIFAVIMVFTIAIRGKDFGPMLKAEVRARKEGKLFADGSKPMSGDGIVSDSQFTGTPKVRNALIPILTLLLVAFFGLYFNGHGYLVADTDITGMSFFDVVKDSFGMADASVVLIWASMLASIVAGVLAVSQKIINLGEVFDAWVDGAKSLLITAIILILAWSLGGVTGDVGTADFLVSVIGSSLPAVILPIIVFIISCLVAFSTGTSWGTMAIVIPLAVPIANAYVTGNPAESYIILATLSAVLSGSIFGDHCSPISDTTIMSSMASSSDHIDHVKTQIPYALTSAAATIVGYLIVGLTGFTIWGTIIAIVVGFTGIQVAVSIFGKDPNQA